VEDREIISGLDRKALACLRSRDFTEALLPILVELSLVKSKSKEGRKEGEISGWGAGCEI